MYRAISIALASALLILAPGDVLARGGGGGGGHGGGGGGHGGGGGGHGGFGGGFGGGHAGFSGGHMGRMHTGPAGPVGFRAMPGGWRGARFDRHVAVNRFNHRHRKVFFIGGYGGDYYSCYPVWNGYVWYNSCDYGY
jgi:hypothetical protein